MAGTKLKLPKGIKALKGKPSKAWQEMCEGPEIGASGGTHSVKYQAKTKHDGDCDIYSSLHNGRPTDGICTCGFGLQKRRNDDDSEMISGERFTSSHILRDFLERLLDDGTADVDFPDKRVWPLRSSLRRKIVAAIGYDYNSERANSYEEEDRKQKAAEDRKAHEDNLKNFLDSILAKHN